MRHVTINQAAYIKESNLILSQKGKTFFWAKFLLNKKHATQAVRLYRFCRYVDDVGDETTNTEVARQMLMQIIDALRNGTSDHPIISDAIALFNESKIEIDIPISLIQGVISDLTLVRIKDEAALIFYCYQVAGTVGLMMSKILDIKDNRAFAHAIDLGIGMQITNICRDVAEDASMNRRYLPASLIGNIEPLALTNPDIQTQDKVKSALATMLATADEYYQSGYHGLCFLPIRARMGIAIASGLYRQIGTNLANRNYAYWLFRSVVSKKLKAWLTLKILGCNLIATDFYFYSKSHNSRLHHPIRALAYSHA
jgi:15-cis-phytoene synthase